MKPAAMLSRIGIVFSDVLIPAREVNLKKWAVIACDQFTSDSAYWDRVDHTVGESPSTLHLILPEIHLLRDSSNHQEAHIRRTMETYLDDGTLKTLSDSGVFVRRTLQNGTIRRGLVVALDLEKYDYHPGSEAIIRASEETIPDRLPPRAAIRRGASLETPHVLVLYQDQQDRLNRILENATPKLNRLYQTALMEGGGSVDGFQVTLSGSLANSIAATFEEIAHETMEQYPFVFATGDGNHSLAAAWSVWQERKELGAPVDDPYRFCLVELVNVFDPGLPFHPIHRVVKASRDTVVRYLEDRQGPGSEQVTVAAAGHEDQILTLPDAGPMAVALVDEMVDELRLSVDYVHGDEEARSAAEAISGCALLFTEFPRDQLYRTVAERGTLPRKAFSLGEARDKRYYLECRSLRSAEK
jgi:hypothetical protein